MQTNKVGEGERGRNRERERWGKGKRHKGGRSKKKMAGEVARLCVPTLFVRNWNDSVQKGVIDQGRHDRSVVGQRVDSFLRTMA